MKYEGHSSCPMKTHIKPCYHPQGKEHPAGQASDPFVPSFHTLIAKALLPLSQQFRIDRDQEQGMSSQESGEDDELGPPPDPVGPAGSEEQDQAIAHPAQGGLHDPFHNLASYFRRDFTSGERLVAHLASFITDSYPPCGPRCRWTSRQAATTRILHSSCPPVVRPGGQRHKVEAKQRFSQRWSVTQRPVGPSAKVLAVSTAGDQVSSGCCAPVPSQGGGQPLDISPPHLKRKSHFSQPSASVIVRLSSIPSEPSRA